MDDIRDIRKPASLSRFLDSNIVRTSPFGRNVSGEKLYRRAERLVAGLHLLTSHVQENEPLRQSTRLIGIKLLSDILALRDDMRNSNSPQFRSAQSTIRVLISHVRMLTVSGLASIQNADVIVEAIDELGNFLNLSQRTPLSESIVLSREDLLSGELSAEKRTNYPIKYKSLLSETKVDSRTPSLTDNTVLKDNVKDTDIHASRTNDISTRSREVLAVLRSGGEIGIRDVASNLPEYSEKMIQRELAFLVAAGHVKKAGLKRWSRYSIANTAGSQ